LIFLFVITSALSPVFAQTNSEFATAEPGAPNRRHSIGSSLFLLGNLAPSEPVYFFLLNYSLQLSLKDILFAEAITWTYYEPLGTYGASVEKYPGKVRAYGIGVGYQRFLWKKFYVTAQATPFWQQFFDEADTKFELTVT